MPDSDLPRTHDSAGRPASAAPDPRGAADRLEGRLFHKLLVALNAPAGWPAWMIAAVATIPILGAAGLWWSLTDGRHALYLGLALAAFTLADGLILLGLPRWRLSFGPVGPQLYTFELPRLLVAALAAPLAAWLGPAPVLVGVVAINLAASLALLWGATVEPQRLALTHLPLAAATFPRGAPPLRVLHVSDLHVERVGRREEQLLRLVRQAAPDLILLTGDYVNLSYVDDPAAHAGARRVLAALAPAGEQTPPAQVYAVLGSPPVDRNSVPLFDGLPIRLLRDQVALVDCGHGRRLALIGLDCTHDPDHDARRLARLAARAPADIYRILLYHSPELMPVAPQFGIDLYLCGHTHGGQVRLPLYGALITSSSLGKRFEMGHYRSGNTHLYISRGVGLEGMGAPRVRFLSSPEVILFSLNGMPKD